MKRKIIKTILSCICLLLIWMNSLQLNVYAEEKEADLFGYEEAEDVVVYIGYEKDDAAFTLVSPSGETISRDTINDKVRVYSGDNLTIFIIAGAQAGQWKIVYDKGSNEKLSVKVDVMDNDFWITDYVMGSMDNNEIPVAFTVSGIENTGYTYSLQLVLDKESLQGKELVKGYGTAGNNMEVSVPLDTVNTYEEYYLLLYVSYTDSAGTTYFDYAYSDSFAYTNTNAPEAMEKVDVTINHDIQQLTASWSEYQDVFLQYYVGGELVSEDLCTAGNREITYPYEEGKEAKIITYIKNGNGLLSAGYEKVISAGESAFTLTLPADGKVSSKIWSFAYANAANTEVTFVINGQKNVEILDGSGSKYLTLPELRNTISVSYTDADGISHAYSRIANVSSVTPAITLDKQLDGVNTRLDTIVVVGSTDADTLTVNGVNVEITDGSFIHTVELVKGNNDIVIEGKIGENSTKLVATVVRGEAPGIVSEGNIGQWIPLFIGLAVSMAGILILCLTNKKAKLRKEQKAARKAMSKEERKVYKAQQKADKLARKLAGAKKRKRACLWKLVFSGLLFAGGSAALWVWFAIRKGFESSTAYIELAYKSLAQADAYLTLTSAVMIAAISTSALAVLLILAAILAGVIKKKPKE